MASLEIGFMEKEIIKINFEVKNEHFSYTV